MNSPKVSVIVPNYNHAPFLHQRLDSVYNQTFRDFEVIILDDCSSDNSKKIIEEYRFRPQTSHIVYNELNGGSPFKQWGKGIDLAQGEYIWIAESDDWAELCFLAEMVSILDDDGSLSFAYCNSYVEDGLKTEPLTQNSFESTRKISGEEMLKHLCQGCCVYNASSVVFRKECAQKVSREYQSFCSSGDYFFWVLLSEMGNVFYSYNALNHYRIHGANTSIKKALNCALIENFQVYSFLKSKGYYSFFERRAFILESLKQIRKNEFFLNDTQFRGICELYKKEIYPVLLTNLFVKFVTFFWKLIR